MVRTRAPPTYANHDKKGKGQRIIVQQSSMKLSLILLCTFLAPLCNAYGVPRSFLFAPKFDTKPQLILIGGCTGAGKSTFGMQTALSQGILKCVSTDTVRTVMRSFVSKEISPALHRSSYDGDGDAIVDWRECCSVLEGSIEALVCDAIERGVGLVVEGVHLVPSTKLIQMWQKAGGVAIGVVLKISDEKAHENLISQRGEITKKGEEKKIRSFGRIRAIQDELVRLAQESEWLLIEQKLKPEPIEIIGSILKDQNNGTVMPTETLLEPVVSLLEPDD